LFWTAQIDRGSVKVNLGSGSAAMHVADLEIEDYGNVVNALMDGPSVDAVVSFDVNWSGVDARLKLRNSSTDFAGEFIRNSATLSWLAVESGFSFASDPLESHFAEIGHERTGVFFR
jgi:hypothetical protein